MTPFVYTSRRHQDKATIPLIILLLIVFIPIYYISEHYDTMTFQGSA